MSDKLVKGSTDIETAMAFTVAIGDAIERNDVEAAQVLSSELRKKVNFAAQMCQNCSHNDSAHWPSGECGRCSCKQFTGESNSLLANVMRKKLKYFPEGKHFATLRSVDVQIARNGRQVIAFELNVTASATLPVGGTEPMYHYMYADTEAQMMLAAAQFQRLGLDPVITGITGLSSIDFDVVVVAVERTIKSTGRTFMSVNLRLPDETDGG